MKSPAVCRAGQVSGRERTPKGRIAAEGLSRLAERSDFDFSMGVFKNEKAPRECNRPPMMGERTDRAKSAARRRSSLAGHRCIGERNVSTARTVKRNYALWRIIMLRTAFIVGAIAASLLLPTTMLQARGGGGHGGGGHGGGGHVGGGGRGGAHACRRWWNACGRRRCAHRRRSRRAHGRRRTSLLARPFVRLRSRPVLAAHPWRLCLDLRLRITQPRWRGDPRDGEPFGRRGRLERPHTTIRVGSTRAGSLTMESHPSAIAAAVWNRCRRGRAGNSELSIRAVLRL
jgi:hypothetical protein